MAESAEFIQGKLFIGLIFNVMLFGINVAQTYFYYIHSKKDRLWIKISVVIIFVADLVQPTFLTIYLYRTLIVHFGNETTLSTANNLFAIVPTMTSLTASIVQIFFAWRIRILTNNWYYVAFIIAAAVSGGACAIVEAYVGQFNSQFTEFRAFKVVAIIGFVSEMLGDIMISTILQKHKSGFRQSNKMVDRIIYFAVRTGLLTLIFAGLDMLFYLISPSGTHLLLNTITSKLYTSSLLSSLNSRKGWGYDTSKDNDGEFDSRFDIDGLRFASTTQSTIGGTSESVVIDITKPPESELDSQDWHEEKNNSGDDLEASVTHGQQAVKYN